MNKKIWPVLILMLTPILVLADPKPGEPASLSPRFQYLPSFEIGSAKDGIDTIGLNAYYLANLDDPDYMRFQEENVHNRTHACNIFVYTVLYSMGIAKLNQVPYSMANFMSHKLLKSGQFQELSFDELNQESLDPEYLWNIVITKSHWPEHGHTVIPVGRTLDQDGEIDPKGSLIVAEGQYHGTSHVLKRYSRSYLLSHPFRYFKYIPNEEDQENAPEPSEQKKSFFKNLFKFGRHKIEAPAESEEDNAQPEDEKSGDGSSDPSDSTKNNTVTH